MVRPQSISRFRPATVPFPAALFAPATAALVLAAVAGAPLPGWMLPAALGGTVASVLGMVRSRPERDDFVAAVSHELRTPVAQIRLLSETLLLGRDADALERARWLEAIAREAEVLDDRIAHVLLVAHGDGLGVAMSRGPVDLSALAEDVAAAHAARAAALDTKVRVHTSEPVVAPADPALLRLALAALLDNAFRYGPSGQVIDIIVERVRGAARISIADEGPGIAPGERTRAWLPFVRLGGEGGTGLGLAVVRRVACAHGGRACLDPRPRGACVRIELPLAR